MNVSLLKDKVPSLNIKVVKCLHFGHLLFSVTAYKDQSESFLIIALGAVFIVFKLFFFCCYAYSRFVAVRADFYCPRTTKNKATMVAAVNHI